jgi:hypothetical protein
MGKIASRDKRYKMLLKIPKIRDGQVSFRKKPSHANKFVLAMIESDTEIHKVFYCMQLTVDEDHVPYMNVIFKYSVI